MKLTFEIKLQSDYHVGAGFGRGAQVDSVLARDADGVPVIRGTVLAGLLRDALWRLLHVQSIDAAHRCEQSDSVPAPKYCGYEVAQFDAANQCPICRLFGTPRNAKHWQIISARPKNAPTILQTGWKPDEGGQVVRRARINPSTRRAEARKLFADEYGDGRLTFSFSVETSGEYAGLHDEAALWWAAARNVREFGRSRRRGRGECLMELAMVEGWHSKTLEGKEAQQTLSEHFRRHWLEGGATSLHESSQVAYTSPQPTVASGAVRVRIIARLDEPLLVAERAEAGNQFETREAIPGTAVRGALAARVMANGYLGIGTAYGDFGETFLRGAVSFPTLYPSCRREGQTVLYPAIPPPYDFLTCKIFPGLKSAKGEHGADTFAPVPDPEKKECPECRARHQQRTGLTRGKQLVVLSKDPLELETVTRSELHIQIDPERQRVVQGRLYGYRALESGQYFVGELVCKDEQSWQRLQTLCDIREKQAFVLRLGRAGRRGYGHTTIWLERCDAEPLTHIGAFIETRVMAGAKTLTLTLLSDLIVADRWGRGWHGFDDSWLTEALGLPVEKSNAFGGTRQVNHFNDLLGLPRWRDTAIVAGSTVGLKLASELTDAQRKHLAEIERDGIGLRREEGFGRVAFNHSIYHQPSIIGGYVEIPAALGLALPGDERQHVIQREADFRKQWTEELDKHNAVLREICGGPGRAPKFRALAAWLHAERQQPIEALIAELAPAPKEGEVELFGEPAKDLKQAIQGKRPAEANNPFTEYGDREKKNFFHERDRDKGNAGRELILSLLKQLQEDDTKFLHVGIGMLAERIAAAAQEEEAGK